MNKARNTEQCLNKDGAFCPWERLQNNNNSSPREKIFSVIPLEIIIFFLVVVLPLSRSKYGGK